jgi:hypothetical protein
VIDKRLALCLSAAVVLSPPALSASGQPSVRVTHIQPLTVAGRNFQPRERVRVVVVAKRQRLSTVVANRRGRFVVRYAFAVGDCTALRVSARGNHGSRASYALIPDCTPRSVQ